MYRNFNNGLKKLISFSCLKKVNMYYRSFSTETFYQSLPNQHILHVVRTRENDNGKEIKDERAYDIDQKGNHISIPFEEGIRLLRKSQKRLSK